MLLWLTVHLPVILTPWCACAQQRAKLAIIFSVGGFEGGLYPSLLRAHAVAGMIGSCNAQGNTSLRPPRLVGNLKDAEGLSSLESSSGHRVSFQKDSDGLNDQTAQSDGTRPIDRLITDLPSSGSVFCFHHNRSQYCGKDNCSVQCTELGLKYPGTQLVAKGKHIDLRR
ncbi:hypothetical protein Q8A73_012849 [Channa argus]|nr:hypothetical protein Q8A73_012849 [Channa argus]